MQVNVEIKHRAEAMNQDHPLLPDPPGLYAAALKRVPGRPGPRHRAALAVSCLRGFSTAADAACQAAQRSHNPVAPEDTSPAQVCSFLSDYTADQGEVQQYIRQIN